MLILAPGAGAEPILCAAGIASAACADPAAIVAALSAGAGAALLTPEAVAGHDLGDLYAWVIGQPAWSDFPFVVLMPGDAGATHDPAGARWTDGLRNVAFVEQPLNPIVLGSVLRTALASRRRQYETRRLIETLNRTATALGEHQETLRFALASAALGAWTLELPSRTLDASTEFKHLFGRAPGDGLAYAEVQACVRPEARALVRDAIERAERAGAPYDIEFPITHPDGSERWIASHARILEMQRPDGVRLAGRRLVGLSGDVTARHERDAELDRHRQGLAALVGERTRELEAANHRLTEQAAERERSEALLRQAQKMEAVGQLTGGIAHDFNNLLAAVMGSLELITRRTEDARILRLAGNATTAVERGARLTRQLLAFSRSQRLDLAPVLVNQLITGMTELLASSLGARMAVAFALAPEAATCLADANQLELAILNLAINARDAMGGGGTLTIRTAPCPPATEEGVPMVAISVVDSGPGMPAAVAERAFEPFFSTKPVGRGSGLGLSQVYGIARQSGGTAVIESAEGLGTTVTILLPRCAEPATPDLPAAAAARPSDGEASGVVLVIDDDPDVRQFLAEGLRELGYRVAEAPHGEAGLALLEAAPLPDLVIVDFAMPGMNGAEVAAEALRRRPGLPLVMATGYAETAALGGALRHVPILRKPFHMADLAATMGRAREAARPGGRSSLGATVAGPTHGQTDA